jgi:arylsulfatase A-like enzyme
MAMAYMDKVKDGENPFCLFVSYGTPHDPWSRGNVPEEYGTLFKAAEFEQPPNFSVEPDPHGDGWSNGWLKGNPDKDKAWQSVQKWRRVYYAMTANLDWNVGRIVDYLEKNGLADNTILVFTSDHGEMFGGHGRMKKNIFYEEAARIPFLVRWPAKLQAEPKDIPISAVDMGQTLLGLMNVDAPDAAEGTDCSGYMLGDKGKTPQYAFLQNTGACAAWGGNHEWRAVRTPGFTYAVFRHPKKELLFDNQADPFQMKNLVAHAAYEDTLETYRCWMKEKMVALKDEFSPSDFYRKNWVDEDRRILRSSTCEFGGVGR